MLLYYSVVAIFVWALVFLMRFRIITYMLVEVSHSKYQFLLF